MRHLAICILIAVLPAFALAQQPPRSDPHQAGISAATDSAVDGLMDQIQGERILPQLTVQDFLDRTGASEELRADLAQSDPIGGPRWLDDKTCQVRLEVSGSEVVADLANIAIKHAARSPIPAGDVPRLAGRLSSGWFAATGTSTAADIAPPPPADSPWAAVPADQRRRAISAAEADAAQAVLSGLEPVELAPGHPLAEALDVPAIRHSLLDWLATRPLTAVDYGRTGTGQLQVQVTLGINASDFSDILRATLTARNDVAHPADITGWAILRDQVVHHLIRPVGRAFPAPTTQQITLPSQPPDWVNTQADAVGRGGPSISSLRAARAAETDAVGHLRRQVLELQLTREQTLGQAAARDPHLARALDRAIARSARLYNSQYLTDGTVVVRVSLDLRLLWAALETRP